MEEKTQFQRMREASLRKLEGTDPTVLAEKTGFRWDGSHLMGETLGISLSVSWPECTILPALEPWHELTVLQYLANAQGMLPTGTFLSLGEFPNGGLARGSSFDRENDRVFARLGGYPMTLLRRAANRLGGREVEGRADWNVQFAFLPRIPVRLLFWEADEEFPASGKLLFDASAAQDFQVEAAGTAGTILLTLLEQGTES